MFKDNGYITLLRPVFLKARKWLVKYSKILYAKRISAHHSSGVKVLMFRLLDNIYIVDVLYFKAIINLLYSIKRF